MHGCDDRGEVSIAVTKLELTIERGGRPRDIPPGHHCMSENVWMVPVRASRMAREWIDAPECHRTTKQERIADGRRSRLSLDGIDLARNLCFNLGDAADGMPFYRVTVRLVVSIWLSLLL
jgi:hypothetical protein